MTLPEIAVICSYQPGGKAKKKNGMEALMNAEQMAMIQVMEYQSLSPRQKIERRLKARNGS